MKITGIIFDFNGVLFWDSHLHEAAWVEYSKRFRGHAFTDEEMHHHMHGRPNRAILEYLAGRPLTDKEVAEHGENKETIYRESCLAEIESFMLSPGAKELLDYLKENKVPTTIATGANLGNLNFYWEHLNLGDWFKKDLVVYDDGKIAGKPAPDCYLQAAEKLGLEPAECLVIEDSKSGIGAARAAGIGQIVALGPKEKHDDLAKTPGVTKVIADFTELLPYLKEQLA